MRRILFFSCLSTLLAVIDFFPPQACGQGRFSIVENRNWHGTDLPDDALRLESDEGIFEVGIDSINHIAYIQTRQRKRGKWTKRGSVTAFDLVERVAKWQTFLNYGKEGFILADGVPVISGKTGSSGLDRDTGTAKWYSDHQVLMGLPGTGTAISARLNNIYKTDLSTGKLIWALDAVASPLYGGYSIYGDTAMVITGAGVTYIDLRNGETWSFKGKIPAVQDGSLLAAGLLGGLVGVLLVGVLSPSNTGISKTGSTLQNHLMLDSSMYFADLKKVGKYDLHGNVVWEFPLPISIDVPKITYRDGELYVIHYGVLNTPDMAYYRDIYVLKIDETRDPVRMETRVLGEGKGQFLNDFLMRDSTVVMAMSDRLTSVSLSDLSVVGEKVLGGPNSRMGMRHIDNPPFYTLEDSVAVSLSDACPGCIYIKNSTGIHIKFTEDLEMESIIKPNDFYVVNQILPGGLTSLQSASETVWVDENGRVRNPIHLGPNAGVTKGYLVDIRDNQLVVVGWPRK